MARRASFSIHPVWVVAVMLLVVGAISAGYFLVGRVNDPFRTLAPLDISAYLENSNSLRGNSYKVTGSIWNYLASSTKVGRLFSVEVGSVSFPEVVPVLIPAEFNNQNIQKGQHFNFSVEVDEKGILIVKDLKKA